MKNYAVMPLTDYINICDKVREKTATTENIKSGEMPEKIDTVYEAGQKSEYDSFWDKYQYDGTRENYSTAFAGIGWTKENLLPKYSVISPSTAYMMFHTCGYDGDLDEVFENRGIKLDLKGCKNMQYLFYASNITAVGEIDCTGIIDADMIPSIFNSPHIVTIRNLIPPHVAMGKTCWSSGLVNLGIGGEIVADFDLSRCTKLTHDSLMSVINALKNYVTITEKTCYDFSVPPYETEMYKFNKKYEIVEISNNSVEFIGEEYEGNNIWGVGSLGGEDIIPLEDVEGATHIIIYEDGSVTFFIPQESTTTHTLTLGSTNLAKLTDEEKAIATEKGWTLA